MLESKRTHIGALAATGAKLRVVREVTGMRQDYDKSQAAQPFAVVSVVARPDRHQQAAVEQEAQQAAGELYGEETFDAEAANNPDMTNEVNPADLGGGDLPDPADFPEPVDWQASAPDDRLEWLEEIIAVTGYDLAGALDGTDCEGCMLDQLPPSWRERLYGTMYEDQIEPQLNVPDNDPPF